MVESVPRYWRERKYLYRLIGSECKKCGRRYFPPRKVCLHCKSTEMREVKLPETGRILTYSIVYVSPRGFEKYVPYIIAIVELDDGTRVFTQLTDIKPEDVKVGMRVIATFRRIREQSKDGIIEYGVKFKPI